MNALVVASWRAAVIGRWTARIAGTLLFLLFLAFFFGEGPPDLSRLSSAERIQALGVAALFVGLPAAWKWEGLGGLITVAGFAFLAALGAGNLHRWVLYVPALAGAVHVASWARLRRAAPAGMVPWRVRRSGVVSLGAALAVFLLLCANEMFGQPPLMTPTLHPGSGLAGDWHGAGAISVELLIHPDGSVTGEVGEAAIESAHIAYGRSWFGRLLHINADYLIAGRLSGGRFTAPLQVAGDSLDGSVFRRGRPMHVTLTRRQP
jgi:hypothetical protein